MNFKAKVKGLVDKNKEENKMKNWSLKKKVVVGLGVLGTAALGVIAYGRSKEEEVVNYNSDRDEDYEDDSDYEDENETYDAEEVEEVDETEN